MENKKKILIIEDDVLLSDMYITKLGLEGYDVIHANEGKKGLDMAISEKPDLILLDVVLPKMDGFEVLKKLKENKDTINTKILVLSNLGQDYEIQKGMRLGADEYMVKANFTPSEVIKRIKKIFKKQIKNIK